MTREPIEAPIGGIKVTAPGATLQSQEIRGVTTGDQGRGISVFAPRTTLFDMVFAGGSDDALGFVGDTRGSMVIGSTFSSECMSKAIVGYTNANASNVPGPIYGHAEGYAASIIGNTFTHGAAIRLADGVWEIRRNIIVIHAHCGIDLLDARCNVIDNDFIAIDEKPAHLPYWMQRNKDGTIHPCAMRIVANVDGKQAARPHKSRLFCANNRIHYFQRWSEYEAWLAGREVKHAIVYADGPALVRSWASDASRKAGWTAYQPDGQGVPKSVFLKGPN